VAFEYTCGTTVRHPSFLMRRLIELRGWGVGALRLAQLRRARRLDAVYLWLTSQRARPSRLAFVALLRLMGVPVVIELNERPWSLRDDRRLVERFVSPLAGVQGVIAISRLLSCWASEEAARRRSEARVLEVPILVDMSESSPPGGLPSGPPTVMFAGAPEYDETVDFIVRSMSHVWPRFPECQLIVTGARPGDPAGEALRRRLEVSHENGERVHLVGYLPRDALLQEYRRAWALLIPLFNDVRSAARFPTKVGEYLASGRPIVTTAVGEMSRLFSDGENAFVATAGDAESYGLKVCEALADRERARTVGAAGRELARAHFDYRAYGRPLVAAFMTLASARKSKMGRRAGPG
jgi:glycosyltransferase involved in cell wall biosynthesis